MKKKTKLDLIEHLETVFEEVLSRRIRPYYSKYFRSVNNDIMEILSKNEKITKFQIAKISKTHKIDTSFVEKNMNFMRLQMELENAILEEKVTPKNAKQMINYVERTGSYDVSKIVRIDPVFYKKVLNQNKKYVSNINRQVKVQFNRINKEIQNGQSSRIYKKYKAISNRAKSFEALESELRDTFKSDRASVDRVLRTEIHAGNERTKVSLNSLNGYTHKTWNTEGDKKVRKSHTRVNKTKVPIDKKFRVGGHWCDYPGDPKLPVGERVNCRCYLTFTKEN